MPAKIKRPTSKVSRAAAAPAAKPVKQPGGGDKKESDDSADGTVVASSAIMVDDAADAAGAVGAMPASEPSEDDFDRLKNMVVNKMRGMIQPGTQTAGKIDVCAHAVMMLSGAIEYIHDMTSKDQSKDPVELFAYVMDCEPCSQVHYAYVV
jgi:hypothetical protein